MLRKKSKYKQSFFDITTENFGSLDNVITVASENNHSISKNLKTNTDLIIDNENLGESDVKAEINNNRITFNNHYDALIYTTADNTLITSDNTNITGDTL